MGGLLKWGSLACGLAVLLGAGAWLWTSAAAADCHTSVGVLAQGIDGRAANACLKATIIHAAGVAGFWLGLVGLVALCAVAFGQGLRDRSTP